MFAVVQLCLLAFVSASLENEEPDMQYTVMSYNYKLPGIPLSEARATNDALFFLRFPQYSLSIRLFCPYELIETEFLTKRVDDAKHCLSKTDLTYWSKEHKKTIVLDSYNIVRKSLSDRKAVDSITVYKAPEGNTHFVTLALSDKTCRKMEYKVGEDLKTTKEDNLSDCKEVEKLNKENDDWIKEHLTKADETVKKEDDTTTIKNAPAM